MDRERALIRLLNWLSPSFPIGGFAYSGGLETAIADKRVQSAEDTALWIEGQMAAGAIRTDAIFLAIAARAVRERDDAALFEANELALALQGAAERAAETREQARSFFEAAAAWGTPPPAGAQGPMALPVAFGAQAGLEGVDPFAAVAGFVNALAGQQISVAVRLIPLGQSKGLAVLARLEPAIADLARRAQEARIEDICGLAYGAEIAAMRHETLSTRIFRS